MAQRIIQGTVISDKMDKTVVVLVQHRKKHRLYHKVLSLTTHFKAHDEENTCRLGDVVRIVESRPLSKEKRWRVIEVLRQGDVADVAPESIGREIEESIATGSAGGEPADTPAAEMEASALVATAAEEEANAEDPVPAAEEPAPKRRTRARKPAADAADVDEAQ